MLFELLSGQKPFRDPTPVAYLQQHPELLVSSVVEIRPDLPAAVDEVIRRATAKEPDERYPDVLSLLDRLRRAAGWSYASTAQTAGMPGNGTDIENPYKGLRAFGEADAGDFFGRDSLIHAVLGRMSEVGDAAGGAGADLARFLTLVGPSGSGKSPVVRAGLIPALRRGGLPGSENWFIAEMVPGRQPLEELAAVLLRIAGCE